MSQHVHYCFKTTHDPWLRTLTRKVWPWLSQWNVGHLIHSRQWSIILTKNTTIALGFLVKRLSSVELFAINDLHLENRVIRIFIFVCVSWNECLSLVIRWHNGVTPQYLHIFTYWFAIFVMAASCYTILKLYQQINITLTKRGDKSPFQDFCIAILYVWEANSPNA